VGWCRAKKYPPSRGDGHFAAKAVRSYGVFACSAGGAFRRFEGGFVGWSGWRLGGFAYFCGMATLQVVGVAAKAAWRSVPVSGHRKTKPQTAKNPVGHE
jgi:hypothetical protein